MFEQIDSKKRSHLAAELLLKAISDKNLKAGDRLPPEREMAKEMNVSRNTLREAVAALQIMGVLEVRRSQGIFVFNTGDNGTLAQSLEEIFASNEDPFSIMEARLAFEPGAAVLTSRIATHQDLREIENCVRRIRKAAEDFNEMAYVAEDRGFHMAVAQKTKNPHVIRTISTLIQAMAQPLWRSMKKGLWSEDIMKARAEEHEAIYQAIVARNGVDIFRTMEYHLIQSRDRFLA